MNTASKCREGALERSDAGITLVETIIVLTLIVVLMGVMNELIITSGEAQNYSNRMVRSTEVGQELINDMTTELSATTELLERGSVGNSIVDALEYDSASPPLVGSRLPQLISSGPFRRELLPGGLVGNTLAMARQAWTTEFTTVAGHTYFVDVYQFVCYYLTKEDGGPRPGTSVGLNLSKFVSEPVADGDQIDNISDATDKQEILEHLVQATADKSGTTYKPVQLVWRRGQAVTTVDAIREIDPISLTLQSCPMAPRPTGAWRLQRDPEQSQSSLLYYRHFSVASNYGTKRYGVAKFGKKTNGGDGFPHGFEVQINGPSTGRRVLLHLTIVSTTRQRLRAHCDIRTTVSVQDS